MKGPIVIMGAGGHAREVADVVLAARAAGAPIELLGFMDDGEPDESLLEPYGAGLIGRASSPEDFPPGAAYLIGIGSGAARRTIDARLSEAGHWSLALQHPTSTVSVNVDLAPGVVLFAGAHLTNNIRLGRHVHVNRGATVGHDSRVGAYSTLGPLSALSGAVRLGDEVFVGTGAVFNPGVQVGDRVTVGSNAAVIGDLGSEVVVAGVPARVIR